MGGPFPNRAKAVGILAIQLNVVLFDFAGENADGTKYQTAYRCEGQTLEITCESREAVIEVVRANYGRFSVAICNEEGRTDFSVDCLAPNSFSVMQNRSDRQTLSYILFVTYF